VIGKVTGVLSGVEKSDASLKCVTHADQTQDEKQKLLSAGDLPDQGDRMAGCLGRFPQLVSLGLRPAKSHEKRGAVRISPRERRDRIEPVEPLRPSNCLIRSVRD
jgi:hypothetical protein